MNWKNWILPIPAVLLIYAIAAWQVSLDDNIKEITGQHSGFDNLISNDSGFKEKVRIMGEDISELKMDVKSIQKDINSIHKDINLIHVELGDMKGILGEIRGFLFQKIKGNGIGEK